MNSRTLNTLIGIGLLGLCLFYSPAMNADSAVNPLDPNLPYQAQRSYPVTYDVDYVVVVTAPSHSQVLKVWLPLPQSDRGQDVEEIEISTFPMSVAPKIAKEKVFGNQFAYFEFRNPKGGQMIRHRFRIKIWELQWKLDPAKVVAVKSWPKTFDPYLKSDHTVVVDKRFQNLAKEIVPEQKGPAQDLGTVMDWLNKNMKFDAQKASLQASSEHALMKRTGHCSDYHGLCAAFGRALGFPTRVTYGINPFPRNSPSHCKLEAFLPPYGWVSFDVSETQKMLGSIQQEKIDQRQKETLARTAVDRLHRGFRDNVWFLQTKGTDYDLVPPASKRVSVVRTIYAEADGVALPEPDPANPKKNEFSWMTLHRYTPDRIVPYPFREWGTLLDYQQESK